MQQIFNELISKTIPPKALGIIGTLFPQFSKATELLHDPIRLHAEIEQIHIKLGEALEFDHRAGYGSAECLASDSAEGSAASRESAGSGDDGNWEEHSSGNVDGPVPEELSGDAGSDSRYETKVQGGEGNQWTFDVAYPTVS